jgi:hypothetical protein
MKKEMRDAFNTAIVMGAPVDCSDRDSLLAIWFELGWYSGRSAMVRVAGSTKSKAKSAAARKNGKMGGRPKKVKS